MSENIQTDEMGAGREMDALIAERVMGFVVEPVGGNYRYYNDTIAHERGGKWTSPVPAYSTEIAAAWEVVEFLREAGSHIQIETQDGYFCEIWSDRGGKLELFQQEGEGWAETPALAICRAAISEHTLKEDTDICANCGLPDMAGYWQQFLCNDEWRQVVTTNR